MYLIKARHSDKDGFFYFYAYFKDEQMTNELLGKKVLEIYSKRWKIEEVFRHIKSEYKLENIQLLNYDRLQSLYLWMFLMITFIYSCQEIIFRLPETYKSLVCDFKNDLLAFIGFPFYRLSKLINTVFQVLSYRKRKKVRLKKYDQRQFTFESCFSNFFGVC